VAEFRYRGGRDGDARQVGRGRHGPADLDQQAALFQQTETTTADGGGKCRVEQSGACHARPQRMVDAGEAGMWVLLGPVGEYPPGESGEVVLRLGRAEVHVLSSIVSG